MSFKTGHFIKLLSKDQNIKTVIINSKCLSPDRIKYLTMTDASKVWMPDTFFRCWITHQYNSSQIIYHRGTTPFEAFLFSRNEKIGSFHNILQPNLYIRIFPDGMILYSIRFNSLNSLYMKYKLNSLHSTRWH